MPGRPHTALLLTLAALAAAGSLCATARADGLPVLGVDVGSQGVAAPTSGVRYVTLHAARGTIVARTAVAGGRILGFMHLPGNFTIPAVAYDGSASGLSADGTTLALIQPRLGFPRARTPLAILDATRLRVRKLVTLRGDFSFDAISPDGTTLFLVQYTSATDPTRYAVRAYDVRSARLLPHPIVDPHERGEAMRGSPLSRAASPDGRWAYTLYDGAGQTPFVHALDTSGRRARCIDLPMLAGRRDLWTLRLDGGGNGPLAVRKGPHALAFVDTRTFAVSRPGDAQAAKAVGASGRGVERAWLLSGAAALTLLAAATLSVAARSRRRRVAAT